jgi:hypothetical protein
MKFGKKAQEEIVQKIEHDSVGKDEEGFPITTFWVFYNIMTWYITHRAVSLNHQVELERRLRRSLRRTRNK